MTAWGAVEEGLFEEPPRSPLRKGDRVVVIAIDGDHRGRVDEVKKVNGYPMVAVTTYDGVSITINRAHVVPDEEDDADQGASAGDL